LLTRLALYTLMMSLYWLDPTSMFQGTCGHI
jgi:hypothetical protein